MSERSGFVTKNGYGKLVVMNMEYYESKIAKIAEADFINEGIVDFENGKVNDGKEVIKELKDKYGI